ALIQGARLVAVRASHRLLRQEFGRGRYAIVTVEIVSAEPGLCEVGGEAFRWEADERPEASANSLWHAELRAAALEGMTFALKDARSSEGVRAVEIRFTTVDTSPDDVKFAASMATWEVLEERPNRAPWIDADGVHFPAP